MGVYDMKMFFRENSYNRLLLATGIIFVCILMLTLCNINVSAVPVTAGNFTVDYNIANDWGGGATVSVNVINNGSSVQDWNVSWTFPDNQRITNMWNATYTQNGAAVVVKNTNWNGTISTNGSQTFGFNLSYSGSNSVPTSFTVGSSSGVPPVVTTSATGPSTTKPPVTTPSVTTPPVTSSPTNSTGKIKGSEVLVIGESFIAMSHEITRYLEQSARSAGILNSNESFRDNSVSGTRLSGGASPTIPEQYQNAIRQSAVKYVIMDGGGNDCLQSGGSATADNPELQNAVNAARTLLNQMNNDGVLKVIYFFYPEPQGGFFGSLKDKLDVLRPMIKNVVTGTSKPKCYWLDLRPVFEGKYSQYISGDGIHPTSAGCKATADAIWNVAQTNNFFN
jgi:lysophospholipase L1-like esterase